MKSHLVALLTAFAWTMTVVIVGQKAQGVSPQPMDKTEAMPAGATGTKTNSEACFAIFVTAIPPGYRDWQLVSVAHEAGNLNRIAAIRGNAVAITACREGKLPFPDSKAARENIAAGIKPSNTGSAQRDRKEAS